MITIPFLINDTNIFRDRYPELRNGAFIRNIVLNNKSYTLKIMPNFFMESVVINILDDKGNMLMSNLPFVDSSLTNYLIVDSSLTNYVMNYNFSKKQFEIKENI